MATTTTKTWDRPPTVSRGSGCRPQTSFRATRRDDDSYGLQPTIATASTNRANLATCDVGDAERDRKPPAKVPWDGTVASGTRQMTQTVAHFELKWCKVSMPSLGSRRSFLRWATERPVLKLWFRLFLTPNTPKRIPRVSPRDPELDAKRSLLLRTRSFMHVASMLLALGTAQPEPPSSTLGDRGAEHQQFHPLGTVPMIPRSTHEGVGDERRVVASEYIGG